MKLPRMPHDELVKRLLSDIRIARDFFRFYLIQDLKTRLDFETLELQSGGIMTEGLKRREIDILYRVWCLNPEGYIYLLVEHQCNPDSRMIWRMNAYRAQLLERYERQQQSHKADKRRKCKVTLPFIYPMILYNGKATFHVVLDIFNVFGQFEGLARTYWQPQLIDFSTFTDEMFIEHQWAGILEWSLKHSIERDFLPAIDGFRTFFKHLKTDYPGIVVTEDSSIASVVEYMMKGMPTPQQAEQIQTAFEALRQEMRIYWEKEMITVVEHFWQQGRQNGKVEGREEGKMEGKIAGKIEGKEEGRIEGAKLMLDAITLLKQGVSTEQAAQKTCLSPEIVQCLYQQLQGSSSSTH